MPPTTPRTLLMLHEANGSDRTLRPLAAAWRRHAALALPMSAASVTRRP